VGKVELPNRTRRPPAALPPILEEKTYSPPKKSLRCPREKPTERAFGEQDSVRAGETVYVGGIEAISEGQGWLLAV
jgi:hypothetical protein